MRFCGIYMLYILTYVFLISLSGIECFHLVGNRALKARVSSTSLAMATTAHGSPPPQNSRKTKDLLKKYTAQKDDQRMQLGPDGLPVQRLKASRPSKYKPIMASGGSSGKRIMNQGSAREGEIINPNRLRILGGAAKGKKIESPEVYLRPMMGKVREALYSTLTHMELFEKNTTRVLDLFSGSGSVGLEALSRGACHATFVDMAEDCANTAMRNSVACGFAGQTRAVCARAEEVLRNPEQHGILEPYGLITLTPPYEEVIYQELIDALCESSAVREDTVVAIEYPVEMGSMPYILGENKFFGLRNRKYGRTVLALYVYRPTKHFDNRPDEFA